MEDGAEGEAEGVVTVLVVVFFCGDGGNKWWSKCK